MEASDNADKICAGASRARNRNLYNEIGVDRASKGSLDMAQKYFTFAIEANPDDQAGYYNMACLYSLKKDTAKACDFLKKAIEKGHDDWKALKKDDTLDNIRQTPCYTDILAGK
jgi:tetratricopeptide (TPR) repeat protein